MACNSCGHTMQNVGAEGQRIFWCPRCGTLKTRTGVDHDDVQPPTFTRGILSACKVKDDGVYIEMPVDARYLFVKDKHDERSIEQLRVSSPLSVNSGPNNGQLVGWIDTNERRPTHIYSVVGWVTGGRLVVPGDTGYLDIVSWDPAAKHWFAFAGYDAVDEIVEVSHWMDVPWHPDNPMLLAGSIERLLSGRSVAPAVGSE